MMGSILAVRKVAGDAPLFGSLSGLLLLLLLELTLLPCSVAHLVLLGLAFKFLQKRALRRANAHMVTIDLSLEGLRP